MTVTYRTAGVDDAAALDRLFDTVFCDTFAHLYRPEDLNAFLSSFTLADWQAQLGDPAFAYRLAEADGKPVGYVKLGPFTLPMDAEPGAMLLEQLYLMKEYHGSRIAQALMDWTFEEGRSRGSPALYLTVFTENHRARRLYDRYGFLPVGRYDFMVGSQADEDIVMRKAL